MPRTCRFLVVLATLTLALPALVRAQVTGRASVATTGAPAVGGASAFASISHDGRMVAFVSAAGNLVAGDDNGVEDVFVHDRQTGTTVLVSRTSAGTPGNARSGSPAISGDGSTVAFVSRATNLSSGAPQPSAYVHDLATGTTTRLELPPGLIVAWDPSGAILDRQLVSLSADGRFVAVGAHPPASNYVMTQWEVFVIDRESGAIATRVPGHRGALSADGRYLAYDTVSGQTITLRDRQTAQQWPIAPQPATGVSECGYPVISADAAWVAFECLSQPVGTGTRVYLHERQSGTTTQISVPAGVSGSGRAFIGGISGDGRYIAFNSFNRVTGDTVGGNQVFRYDRLSQTWALISRATTGRVVAVPSYSPSISADGSVVAFASAGTHFVAGDTDTTDEVFVADLTCAYAASPTTIALPAAGGSANINVTTAARCGWIAERSQPWVTIGTAHGPPGSSGSGVLTVSAPANTSGILRSAQINVSGHVVAVTQPPADSCTVTVNSPSPVSPAAGGGVLVAVTASAPGCTWTATPSAPWITAGMPSGTGSAQFTASLQPNPAAAPRSATIAVGASSLTITQAGTACAATISPPLLQVPGSSLNVQVGVTASLPGCPWASTSAVPWITLSPPFGIGSGSAVVGIAANTGSVPRSGTVTLAWTPFTVEQARAPLPTDPPGPPENLSATVIGNTVTLTWRAPTSGSAPTGYVLEAGSAPGAANLAVAPVGLGTGLSTSAPNGTYYVRVKAVSSYGVSLASNEVLVEIGCVAPPSPPSTMEAAVSGSAVTLSWSASARAETYILSARAAPWLADLVTLPVVGTRLDAEAPPGVYYLSVRARNACGVSGSSPEAIAAVGVPAPPPPPLGLTASVTGRLVRFTWTPPAGPAPTGYVIEAGSAPGLANLARLPIGASSSFDVADVPSGVYHVQLRAQNAQGVSLPSIGVTVVVP